MNQENTRNSINIIYINNINNKVLSKEVAKKYLETKESMNNLLDSLNELKTDGQSLYSSIENFSIFCCYSFSNFPPSRLMSRGVKEESWTGDGPSVEVCESNIISTVNFTTKLYRGDLSLDLLIGNISQHFIGRMCIIVVDPFQEEKEYIYLDKRVYTEGRITVIKMNLVGFFEELENHPKIHQSKEDIGVSPLVIFQNITWSSILYIARLYGYIIHGGTSTNRHKLSLDEYKLSINLYLSGLFTNKPQYYSDYIEKLVSANKHIKIEELNNVSVENIHYYFLYYHIRQTEILSVYSSYSLELQKLSTILREIASNESSLESLTVKMDKQCQDLSVNSDDNSVITNHTIVETGIGNQQTSSLVSLNTQKDKIHHTTVKLHKVLINTIKNMDESQKYANTTISNMKNYLKDMSMDRKDTLPNSVIGIRRYSTGTRFNHKYKSEIYFELETIIRTEPLNENTQLKIESFLYNQGLVILAGKINREGELNIQKLSPNILTILKKEIDNLYTLLDNLKLNLIGNEHYYINLIDNKKIISWLLGRLLKIISNDGIIKNSTIYTNVAIDLAEVLLFEVSKLDQTIEVDSYSQEFLFSLGSKLLNLLIELDLITIVIAQLERKEKISIIRPNKVISEKLSIFELLDLPLYLPMIIKPNNYSKSTMGGYLLNGKEFNIPMIIDNWEIKQVSTLSEQNLVYDTLNKLNKVAFKINITLLDYIMEYGMTKHLIMGNFVHPLTKKVKLSLKAKKELESYKSKKYLEQSILTIASLFKHVPEFYIPVRIDNRGRVYCISQYLNYQSVELAKALLLFSKGVKVLKSDKISMNFMKIYGANCYGFDKLSFIDRIKWVEENEFNILNIRTNDFIDKAENKLLFLAWAFEYNIYKNALNDDKTYWISHLPIQFDGTCNGYQHLALLMGDKALINDLNLGVFSDHLPPKDFYGIVSIKLQRYFEKMISEIGNNVGHSEYPKLKSYHNLSSLTIPRTLIKSPIMTKPYNASIYQMAKYIEEEFNIFDQEQNIVNKIVDDLNNDQFKYKYYYKNNKDIVYTRTDFNLLAQTIDKIIYTEYPKLEKLSQYLKTIANICTDLNIAIPWLLPTGLKVQQYYIDSEAIRLKPFKYRKYTFTLKIPIKNKIHRAKQIRALMPNLIHSLDSASLTMLVNSYGKHRIKTESFNFFAVHDCFAVPCNEVVNLFDSLKTVYITIYSDDSYLLKFDEGIINQIITYLGTDAYDTKNRIIKLDNRSWKYPDVKEIIQKPLDKNILQSPGLN